MNLKRLSELLELSPTTVSRALNGYPEVNEETRERVREAAKRLGYEANPVAKKLATGKAMAIGHVVPIGQHALINPHFSDFIAGAGETYAQAGYDMIITVVPHEREEAAYRQMKAARKVDGVIVHNPQVNDRRIELLCELEMPFIVHGRSDGVSRDYSWLDVDNRRAFRRATDLLLDLGHRQFGLLNGVEIMNFAHRRRAGFIEALQARDVTCDPQCMFGDEMIEPNGYRRMRVLLERRPRPTAVLVSSVLLALGALRAIREMGLEPGRDISLITYDDQLSFLQNSGETPLFTATRSSIRDAGKRCAELVIAIANDPTRPTVHELWETELVIGQSTGPAGVIA